MAVYDINGNELETSSSSSNYLSGKSLCCAGDSLTDGVALSTLYPQEKTRPTYGRVCAENNNMQFTNAGWSGSTMTNITIGGSFRNGFSVDRYKNIGDKDYLTLWFGFNDFRYGAEALKDVYCQEHFSKYYKDCTSEEKAQCNNFKNWNETFVGTLDSTDNTTWCGAWNVVLNYLTRNYPDMHIGVILPIITDGNLKDPMRNNLVAICKKYGIPYIDSMNVNEWTSFGFTDGLSTEMQNYYFTTRTADGYLHPNERCNRMMANYLTDFLHKM